jgi:hypothetical protein
MLRSYTFYQGYNSDYNIKQDTTLIGNLPGLKKECDSTSGCVGFNTNAWFKKQIPTKSKWENKWPTNPDMGMYVVSNYVI